MSKIVSINKRGTLTLPKDLRERLGLEADGQVVVEETEDGVLIKPGATFPVETYSDERVAEFQKNNEEALKDFDLDG